MADIDELEQMVMQLRRRVLELEDIISNHIEPNATADYPHPFMRVQYLEFAPGLGIGSQLAGPTNGQVLTADNTVRGGLKWAAGGGGGSVPDATETVKGIARLATQTETNTGTNDATIVTPLKLANWTGRVRKALFTIGNGTSTVIEVAHNFGTRDVVVQVYDNNTFETIACLVTRPTTNTVRLTFISPPSTNQFRVLVLGL